MDTRPAWLAHAGSWCPARASPSATAPAAPDRPYGPCELIRSIDGRTDGRLVALHESKAGMSLPGPDLPKRQSGPGDLSQPRLASLVPGTGRPAQAPL